MVNVNDCLFGLDSQRVPSRAQNRRRSDKAGRRSWAALAYVTTSDGWAERKGLVEIPAQADGEAPGRWRRRRARVWGRGRNRQSERLWCPSAAADPTTLEWSKSASELLR